jgi:hypothetical protein
MQLSRDTLGPRGFQLSELRVRIAKEYQQEEAVLLGGYANMSPRVQPVPCRQKRNEIEKFAEVESSDIRRTVHFSLHALHVRTA